MRRPCAAGACAISHMEGCFGALNEEGRRGSTRVHFWWAGADQSARCGMLRFCGYAVHAERAPRSYKTDGKTQPSNMYLKNLARERERGEVEEEAEGEEEAERRRRRRRRRRVK